MYIPVLNPVDSKTHLSPLQAEQLVYFGHASYVLMDGKRMLRYLTDYEELRVRADVAVQYDRITDERVLQAGRGGKVTGVWRPQGTGAGSRTAGAPRIRCSQYEMTLEWIAQMNRDER